MICGYSISTNQLRLWCPSQLVHQERQKNGGEGRGEYTYQDQARISSSFTARQLTHGPKVLMKVHSSAVTTH